MRRQNNPPTRNLFLIAFLLFLSILQSRANSAEKLPPLQADLTKTTVSGLSSGAYMANQFHIVHSDKIIGAGLVAGGPFGCAESWQATTFWFWPGITSFNAAQATEGCMKTNYQAAGIPSPRALIARAKSLAQRGDIDPLANLNNDRVYLFTGGNDTVVHNDIVEAAGEFYERAGVPRANLTFEKNRKAGHTFLTEETGNDCDISKTPYIADCDYDQAGAILKSLYGGLNPKGAKADGIFQDFDQNEFTSSLGTHGMAATGSLFIPNECRSNANCKIHIVFHGCKQAQEEIGDLFVKKAGFAEWAVTNQLILLFPQIKKEKYSNPYGCWDWWGYTGSGFTTKSAPQIEAVWLMINRLAQSPASHSDQ